MRSLSILRAPLLIGWIFAILLAFMQCQSQATSSQTDARGSVDPRAVEAAKKFLYGWADGDKELLRNLLAKKPENFYGPCLFVRMPTLKTAVRTEDGLGAVDFEGETTDPALPKQGTILMNYKNLGSGRKWLVRAIVWKGADSGSLPARKSGYIDRDHSQETHMRTAAQRFIRAWLNEDWPTMEALTFDWIKRRKRPLEKEVFIRSLKLRPELRPDGSVRVSSTITASPRTPLARMLRYTATGLLYTVKEDGEWRIRGITASLLDR